MEFVRVAPELPHPRVQNIRLLRIHRQGGTAGIFVHVQNTLPFLAAIGGLVDAALLVRIPQMPQRAGVHRVRFAGIDENGADALGIFQANLLPTLAAVGRFVQARTD